MTSLPVEMQIETERQAKNAGRDRYKVVEIFYSLQGEGDLVGTPSVFLRLAHCNLSCSWCDTDYNRGDWMTRQEILDAIAKTRVPYHSVNFQGMPDVILTGGEPSLWVDLPLVEALQDAGYRLTMETNGILWKPAMRLIETLSISPKTPHGWWWENQQWARPSQRVFKLVYDPANPHFSTIYYRILGVQARAYFLQPLETRADGGPVYEREGVFQTNAAEVVEKVKGDPRWRLSLQTHKILGLR